MRGFFFSSIGVPRFGGGISCHHTYFAIRTSSILTFLYNPNIDMLLIIGLKIMDFSEKFFRSQRSSTLL